MDTIENRKSCWSKKNTIGRKKIAHGKKDVTIKTERRKEHTRNEMRYTFVKQHDMTDCAAACLAMVCLHYKKETTITRLRDRMGTDIQGTNLLGLSKCADQRGVKPLCGHLQDHRQVCHPGRSGKGSHADGTGRILSELYRSHADLKTHL